MTVELVASAMLAGVVGLVLWLIQRAMTRQEKKIDEMANDIKMQGKEFGSSLTEIKIIIRDYVTWNGLDKEMGPVKCDIKDHERRIIVLETETKKQSRLNP